MNKAQSPVKSNLVSLGRIQVPAKNGSGVLYRPPDSNDLDLMIGDLESDLNRQGITATNKGDCGSCGRPIIGQVVTALGKIFHPEHFTCAMCNTKLGNQSFFEREGLAYCEEDYHKLYSPRCNHCSKPILDVCTPIQFIHNTTVIIYDSCSVVSPHWTKHGILNTFFVLIVERTLATMVIMKRRVTPIVVKIFSNCLPLNVSAACNRSWTTMCPHWVAIGIQIVSYVGYVVFKPNLLLPFFCTNVFI